MQLSVEMVPDIWLLDVAMPGMSGWQLLDRLRSRGDLQPVMMVSAEADEGKWRQIKNRGEVRYLVKPVQMTLLLENMGEMLNLTDPRGHHRGPRGGHGGKSYAVCAAPPRAD